MLALCLSLLFSTLQGVTPTAARLPIVTNHVICLQIETGLVPKETFEVIASCKLHRVSHLDTSDYRVTDVTISLISHRSGYGNHAVLHSYESKAIFSASNLTTSDPLWGGKYIPGTQFLLPSARICVLNDELYYVLLADSKMFIFKVSRDSTVAHRVTSVSKAKSPSLKSLWENTFSPHDVYWCYYLVTLADRFGLPKAQVDHRRFVDTQYLDDLYEKIKRE